MIMQMSTSPENRMIMVRSPVFLVSLTYSLFQKILFYHNYKYNIDIGEYFNEYENSC